MKNHWKSRLIAGMILGLLTARGFACPAAALTVGECQAAKMKEAAKNAMKKLQCHAKAARTGKPLDLVCIAKAESAFAGGIARIEAKGNCPTPGDAAVIEVEVYSFVNNVVAALPPEAATPIDLRTYFPAVTNVYRTFDGRAHAKYSFFFVTQNGLDPFWGLYSTLFDLGKPDGQLLIWQKIYASNVNDLEDLNCTATYAHLFLGGGADKGVIEVGDWLNNNGDVHGPNGSCPDSYRALGYQRATSFATPATGLNWSGPGGLDSSYTSFQSGYVFHQASPGTGYLYNGYGEYSTPGLVEFLPNWSPEYGRGSGGAWGSPGTTYTNVVHMVLFHGVSGDPISCSPDRGNPYSTYYLHVPGFRSYAIELYMDQAHGILQETLLYDELGYFGYAACSNAFPALAPRGGLTQAFRLWRSYLDN